MLAGAVAMSLALSLHSPALLADATPSASPSPALSSSDDFDSVCGSLMDSSQASGAPSPNAATDPKALAVQQKLQYCQAAKSAQEGADADSALWKVWAAVGVVCTYGCIASFTAAPSSEYICMGASLAGGITDAAVTKNYASALMSIAGAGAGYAINHAMSKGAEEGAKAGKEGAKKQKDIGACLNAAMAAFQVFTKVKSMQSGEEAAKSNLASAKAVTGPNGTALDSSSNFQLAAANGVGGNTGSGGSTASLSNGVAQSGANPVSNSCASSSPGAIIQCAIASDKNLPGFVSDPKFASEFQKNSGQSLSGFLSKNDPPSQMMASAMSNGLNADQSAKLASAIGDVQQSVGAQETSYGTYASGGGGGAGESGADPMMAQMGQVMQGLMDQMNPGKKQDETGSGVGAVIFANKTRTPASVVEDRKLNLFDRVTYRYYFVGRRLIFGEVAK